MKAYIPKYIDSKSWLIVTSLTKYIIQQCWDTRMILPNEMDNELLVTVLSLK